mmetsp:Transcript_63393/g.112687  ORF Transcript_63393/g.112687 Transcript_63393/m.112687 type:complete len:287 (+) Transcript_63393:45-905(+)|eukprot:CAMPEP_0197636166 /NCGR_PEP_ID=MMETSP1338-20131121/11762_1 /TAXON_ID=43686 ORGANISM="Pelagodinium beii, Strain RCC1491" /NCGR_SAMPLE_ID=MMETSP1338 /ASSEMBLY_ACC=CAM_ASM_000754 /LENGTH=286 /DNA_ID=CAMNT_0043208355 /DNA_START=34 /DNA_END=894 /DNA_ORIENTATION=-
MTSRHRSVFRSTVVAAWLVGALTLGRLVSEYVPVGSSLKQGVLRREVSYAKLVPRSVAAVQSFTPATSVAEPTIDRLATNFLSGLLLGGLAAACIYSRLHSELEPGMSSVAAAVGAAKSSVGSALVSIASAGGGSVGFVAVASAAVSASAPKPKSAGTPQAPKPSHAGMVKQMEVKGKHLEVEHASKHEKLYKPAVTKKENVQVEKSQVHLRGAIKGQDVHFASPFNLWKDSKIHKAANTKQENRQAPKRQIRLGDAINGPNFKLESPFKVWKKAPLTKVLPPSSR